MQIKIKRGKYVVAVSGGVDSVVLLDVLAKHPDLKLIVAHFDHGIRQDSSKDREFVAGIAKKYNLSFVYEEGKLGAKASEEQARKARYDFLETVRIKHKADAIITAHHQDDVLETICINILRGTKRKGLSSLTNTTTLQRPLLEYSKQEILQYAKLHNLQWREDTTNAEHKYLRNKIRHTVIPNLTDDQKHQLITTYKQAKDINKQADALLDGLGAAQEKLAKKLVLATDHQLACEIIAHWLRAQGLPAFDSKIVERLVVSAKTLQPGKQVPIYGGHNMIVGREELMIA